MKRPAVILIIIFVSVFVVGTVISGCSGDSESTSARQTERIRIVRPEPGLAAVTDITALPLLRFGSLTKQVSSHDKDGGNDDGFAGSTQLYTDDNGEHVVFDDYGPGCVYRIWFTAILAWTGRIRIYVDDMDIPVVDAPFISFFQSTLFPFVYPLTNTFVESSGGYVNYIPICYRERAKITLSIPPEFYNITYRRYDTDTVVASYTGTEEYTRLFEQWENPDQDPKPSVSVSSFSGSLSIPGGGTADLLTAQGAGAIWNLLLEVNPFDLDTLSSLWLVALWDGHSEPDVEAPLNEFFGSYLPEYPAAGSLLLGSGNRRCYCRLPMPYWSSARIRVENRGTAQASLEYDIEIYPVAYPEASGYFTALYHRENPTTLDRDYRFARLDGAGHYIGTTYSMKGSPFGSYMEGDERFVIDNSRSPAIYGTGTEDYFNGGWYFFIGPFSNPVHGNPYRLVPTIDFQSRTGCYRMHIGDLVPFFSEARLGIEHDMKNMDTTDAHSSVAYFYRRLEPLLRLSDEMDLSDPLSRTAHQYQARDATPTTEITSGFEGDDDNVTITDQGYSVQTESEFLVQIDPLNTGVLLRRQFDQYDGRQRADVYVDGRPAGVWYDVYENPDLRWAESDFLLPPSLTGNKDRILIRIVNRSGVSWSEFAYKIFSYRLP